MSITEMDMKEFIVATIRKMVGVGYLYFSDSLDIVIGPTTVKMWGVCSSPDNDIWLMDNEQFWHKLEPSDLNYHIALNALNDKLSSIIKSFLL